MRRLLLRILYGPPAWRALWALEQRCTAAGADVVDALTMAGVLVRRIEGDLVGHLEVTKHAEAVARLRRNWPRLAHATAATLVRLAHEGLVVEDVGR